VKEHFFVCPYCWERISILLDPSEAESSYVEDCEVCCRPIEIEVRFAGETLLRFEARRMEGI